MSLYGLTTSLVIDVLCMTFAAPAHVFILYKIFKIKRFYRSYPLELNLVVIAAIVLAITLPLDITDKVLNYFQRSLGQFSCTLRNCFYTTFTNAMIFTLFFIAIHRIHRVRASLMTVERSWLFLAHVVEVVTSWITGILSGVINVVEEKKETYTNEQSCTTPQTIQTEDIIDIVIFLILLASLLACWCLVVKYIRNRKRVYPITVQSNNNFDAEEMQTQADEDLTSTVTAFDGNFDQDVDDMVEAASSKENDSKNGSIIDANIDQNMESQYGSQRSIVSRRSASFLKTKLSAGQFSRSASLPYYKKMNMKLSQATSCISDSVLIDKKPRASVQEKRNSFRSMKSKSSKYIYTRESQDSNTGSRKRILRRSVSYTERTENSTESINTSVHLYNGAENKTISENSSPRNSIDIEQMQEFINDEIQFTSRGSTTSAQGNFDFKSFEKRTYRESIEKSDENDISLKSFSANDFDEESHYGQVFLSPDMSKPSTVTFLPNDRIELMIDKDNSNLTDNGRFDGSNAPGKPQNGDNHVQIKITRPSTDFNQVMVRRDGINQGFALVDNHQISRGQGHYTSRTEPALLLRPPSSPTTQVSKRMILAILIAILLLPKIVARIVFSFGNFPSTTIKDVMAITLSIRNLVFCFSPYLYIFYNKIITKLLFSNEENNINQT